MCFSLQSLQKTQLVIEVTANGTTDSSIDLTWNVVGGNSSSVTYIVRWNETSETGFSIGPLQGTFKSVSNLQSNTRYSFIVVASSNETSNEITIATSKYNKTIRLHFRHVQSQRKVKQ